MNLSGRKKGVIFSYVLLAAESASGLFFTPFLIRTLGQAEFGVYSLSLTITAYLTLLDLGVGNALVRYIAGYRAKDDIPGQKKFIGFALLFYLFICILMLALFALLNQNLELLFGRGLTSSELDLASALLMLTIANAGVTMLVSIFDKVIIAYELFAVSKILQILKIIVRVIVQVMLLFAGFASMGIVASNLALTIVFGIATTTFVVQKLHLTPQFKGFDFGFVKEVFAYTSFIFIQMVATQINAMADQIILGALTTSVVLGIYAVGAQINQYFQTVASGINGVTMPGIVKLVSVGASSSKLEAEMIKVGRLSFIVIGILLGGFIAVGDSFVVLWAGEENADSFYVAAIVMAPLTFSLIQASGSQILWAMGKHQIQALIKIAVAIVNVGLTVALVKWNPLIGAAAGTATACFFGDIAAMNIVYRKYIGIKMSRYYYGLLSGIAPSILFGCFTGLVIKSYFPIGWSFFAIEVLAILFVYIISLWLFGFNDYEKSLFSSFKKKFLRKRRVKNGTIK